MSIEELFSYSFVISVDDDRYKWYKNVFKYYKIPLSEKVGEKVLGQDGIRNCIHNHCKCVQLAKQRNYPFALIFEDDAYPCKTIISDLEYYKDKISDLDCEFLMFGYHMHGYRNFNSLDIFNKPEYKKAYGTQSYIIYKKFYDTFLDYSVNKNKFADEWFIQRRVHLKPLHYHVKFTKNMFCQYNIKKSLNHYAANSVSFWDRFIIKENFNITTDIDNIRKMTND